MAEDRIEVWGVRCGNGRLVKDATNYTQLFPARDVAEANAREFRRNRPNYTYEPEMLGTVAATENPAPEVPPVTTPVAKDDDGWGGDYVGGA